MKTLILALLLLAPAARADISVPRAMQYGQTIYDVSVNGGGSVAHPSGLVMPGGAVLTGAWVYINTQFAASGTESLGISCAGSQDILAFVSIKNIAQQKMLQAQAGVTSQGNTAGSYIGANAAALAVDDSAIGSIPSDCEVVFNVRSGAGFTPYTQGKLTTVLEFFRL